MKNFIIAICSLSVLSLALPCIGNAGDAYDVHKNPHGYHMQLLMENNLRWERQHQQYQERQQRFLDQWENEDRQKEILETQKEILETVRNLQSPDEPAPGESYPEYGRRMLRTPTTMP